MGIRCPFGQLYFRRCRQIEFLGGFYSPLEKKPLLTLSHWVLCFEHVMLVSLYFMIRDIFCYQEKPEKNKNPRWNRLLHRKMGRIWILPLLSCRNRTKSECLCIVNSHVAMTTFRGGGVDVTVQPEYHSWHSVHSMKSFTVSPLPTYYPIGILMIPVL